MCRKEGAEFVPVNGDDEAEVQRLSDFATAIVREHFDPMVGKAQNDYMLKKFQSPEAIREQIAGGYRYYWMKDGGRPVGFTAFYPRDGKMYLSKFYIEKKCRGKGYARQMFDFLVTETKKAGLPAIFLNVFRGNTEVAAIYRHLGFAVIREEEGDIGGGFRTVAYVMEYRLPEQSA